MRPRNGRAARLDADLSFAAPLVVKNTFLCFDLSSGNASVRCRSAPAEVMVESVIAAAVRREAAWRRRKAKRISEQRRRAATRARRVDENILHEYAALARQERWADFVKKLIQVDAEAGWLAARGVAAIMRKTVPKKRVSISRPAFRQLAYWTCGGDTAALRRMGVLRDGADSVEIWAADDAMNHSVMQALLSEARRFVDLCSSGAFQLAMLNEQAKTFRWSPGISADDLRATASAAFDVGPDVRLMHLGVALVSGPLANYGVGPGSTVLLTTDKQFDRA